MPLRICLVTPHAWTVPHDTNEHVAGVADALRARSHDVVVLAPSSRSADLLAGRRALQAGELQGVVAVSRAVPVSPRSAVGIPVGVRANVATALRLGGFDVVHGFDPGLPGLAYVALLEAETTTAATFVDPERLSYPPRRNLRDRLLARVDHLVATGENVAQRAAERFPGSYTVVPAGVDLERFSPRPKADVVVIETSVGALPVVRAALRALRALDGWEAVLVRTARLAARPSIPLGLRDRVHIRTAVSGGARAEILNDAAIVVPSPDGLRRLRVEASAAGCAVVDPPGVVAQPELAAAGLLRFAEDARARERDGAARRASVADAGFDDVAERLEALYTEAQGRKRRPRPPATEPLADREWIVADLHMHTNHSHDCSIEPGALVEHAEDEGLGAIAVTDHNVFEGALETAGLARGRDLVVIPGEEVKTDRDGEVIGLFLREEIPRGMSFADTVAAIREQEGVVYVPHPFDRMHAIPAPATLHRHLPEIDVLEVYNARLLFDTYNDEALRFARKYGLLMGAGSDAHVLQGVGTGALRMRRFDGPEEFLLSLRTATVLRRPKSLAYLQSLKWVAQVRDRVGSGS
ncbi:MAG TPA: glycosyltransferase [Gaiella sp.]|uniref:glycosyltransferase n=1 Tax=Gaiella sp. TaxID=2663207 RepID=UPI002D80A4F4|nr:glycosyltransferase [Gaiella sp.]HET9286332.1 glycosyltransferase [Gaiella sp.]